MAGIIIIKVNKMDAVHQLKIEPGMSIDALVRGWSHVALEPEGWPRQRTYTKECFLEILQNF